MENTVGKSDGGTTNDAGRNSVASDSAAATASGPVFIDPASLGHDNSGGSNSAKRRGRPRGSTNGRKPQAEEIAQDNLKRAPFSIDGVSAILLSIHQMLAGFTNVPELEIDPSEAAKVATALKGVADCYDIKPTEKTLAWSNLVAATAMVYGTRVFAYRMRMATEKTAPRPQAGQRPSIVS